MLCLSLQYQHEPSVEDSWLGAPVLSVRRATWPCTRCLKPANGQCIAWQAVYSLLNSHNKLTVEQPCEGQHSWQLSMYL
jgi:hypothetical protein